jgi:hypothetical protein
MRVPTLLIGALAVVIAATVLMSRVRDYTLSDPQLTLLTSQVLWERGSLDLRPEFDRLGPDAFAKDSWKYRINSEGQVLYAYPFGTSLLALPAVAAGRVLGADLADWNTDRRFQITMAALCSAVIFILLARIGWLLIGRRIVVGLMFSVVMGSSLVSTVGSALWSFNAELICALLAIHEIARTEARPGEPPRAFLAGVFIALAWICRPSAITLAVPLGLMMLAHGTRALGWFAAGVVCVGGPFLLFCHWATGSFLTSYYAVGQWARVSSLSMWPMNLESILFSPARGLFVFTPALIFGVLALGLPAVRRRPLARLLAAWVVLTVAMVATQRNWWGGWGFGPRLLTEVVPGLALLGVMGFQAVSHGTRRRLLGVAALLLVWGAAVHTVQGLYNPAAYGWNDRPNIDAASEYYRHNWRFPQFLATWSRNDAKAARHGQ